MNTSIDIDIDTPETHNSYNSISDFNNYAVNGTVVIQETDESREEYREKEKLICGKSGVLLDMKDLSFGTTISSSTSLYGIVIERMDKKSNSYKCLFIMVVILVMAVVVGSLIALYLLLK